MRILRPGAVSRSPRVHVSRTGGADGGSEHRPISDVILNEDCIAALARLPERQRAALQLFHFEGMSQVDVGRALGVSDEAVESLLARARRTLKADLKDEWIDLLPEEGRG